MWSSTTFGNAKLDEAYSEATARGGSVFLLFSLNGSGKFNGLARMESVVDYSQQFVGWLQAKWSGVRGEGGCCLRPQLILPSVAATPAPLLLLNLVTHLASPRLASPLRSSAYVGS